MESAGGIDDKHVSILSLRRCNGIVNHRCRVASLGMLYYGYTRSFAPDFKLIYSRRTEGIRCRKYDLFAVVFEAVCDFCHRGGLAHTVYAYDKHHGQAVTEFKRLALSYHFTENFHKSLLCILGLCDSVLTDAVVKLFDDFLGRTYAHVCRNEYFLKLLEHLLVYLYKPLEDVIYLLENRFLCLFETCL